MRDYEKIENCIDQISSCGFECEGGPLHMNRGWIYLNINIGLMQERIEELESQLKHIRGVLEPCAEDLESICDAAMPLYKHADSGWRLSRRCNTNDVINVLHDRAFGEVTDSE